MKHDHGKFESVKFEHRRKDFKKYLQVLEKNSIPTADWMEHYTSYIGHMSLNRTLTLYEMYKKVSNIAGHIAEVGIYKGASTLLFAKLVKIFEAESLTQVHGFDWFLGTGKAGKNDSDLVPEGGYKYEFESLSELVKLQKLDNIIRIHNLDVTKELNNFFQRHKHLQFKLCFLDAGIYEVLKSCLPVLWDRLTPGGIMIFDQYNHELAPGETIAIRELLPDVQIQTIPNAWMPNAFAIKGS
ncbi:class I SAM-dependent methyltransferase [Gammaproteobacteria bacterium]|nr:class I SAM-dependent methyltransferase [Gammaproteobacteria bacterium]